MSGRAFLALRMTARGGVNCAYTISALVNSVAMASADCIVPDRPVQRPFACTSG